MSNPLMSCGGFAHVFKQIAFKRPTLQLFTDMYDLTLILEAHHFHITPLQIREATIKRSQIRDKVLLLSKQQRLEQSEPDPVLEATLLASIIYLRALVYLIPFRDPVNHRIAHLLRLSLSRSMPQRSWHQLPGLLLLTLMVGGASVLDQPDFPFFSGHVMGEGIAISVMYFEEMHHILLKFLWIVNMLDRVPKFSYGSGVEESPGPAMFDFLVNQDLDAVAKRTTALRS
jgi:hypothetical protein